MQQKPKKCIVNLDNILVTVLQLIIWTWAKPHPWEWELGNDTGGTPGKAPHLDGSCTVLVSPPPCPFIIGWVSPDTFASYSVDAQWFTVWSCLSFGPYVIAGELKDMPNTPSSTNVSVPARPTRPCLGETGHQSVNTEVWERNTPSQDWELGLIFNRLPYMCPCWREMCDRSMDKNSQDYQRDCFLKTS